MNSLIPTDALVAMAAENARLRSRLAESEELLHAIRDGEVDALVIEGGGGPRIFTLQGLDAESNRFRGTILRHVGDAVLVADPDDRIVYMNPAAERLYATQASFALGRHLHELYHEIALESGSPAERDRALERHGAWRGEVLHRRHDGAELPLEVNVTVFRDGAIRGTLILSRDIRQRREAERALKRSEERNRQNAALFAEIIEQAPGGVYVVDAEFRMLAVNTEALPVFASVQPLLGRDFTEVMHTVWGSEVGQRCADIFHHTLETGERYVSPRFEEVRADTGLAQAYEWETQRVTLPDGRFGVVCYFNDVTERKRVEQQLRDADRRKDEFLATLAHELRNPLAPVRNAVHVLQLRGGDHPELRWASDVIDRQVQQMIRLIDDLMDVSRVNQGRMELRRERAWLGAVVRGALETSRPLVEEGGHALDVSMPAPDVLVDCDPTRLAQVVLNLLNNAAKYTPHGGRITLAVAVRGDDVVLRVRDTGIGIPREALPTIFGMFSQVEGALSRSHGGLGIGLFLVRRLVELHGGRIEAHSDGAGQGSEFVVQLPIVLHDAAGGDAVPAAPPAGLPESHLRIAVVDDNEDAAISLAMLLELMGNTARIAHDGHAALALVEQFQPQVVLLDIGLPGMNGYEAARAIRMTEAGRQMLLVAVTGWGQLGDRQRAVAAGFDHHMVKPVDPQALMTLISTAGQAHT